MYVRRAFSEGDLIARFERAGIRRDGEPVEVMPGIWGATLAMAFYLDLVNGDPL